MEVLFATQAEFEELNGYLNNQRRLEFQPTNDGKYYVGAEVLTDEYFTPIIDKLKKLQRGEL